MPHLTARVPEAQLAGREPALITALTDAVVEVYGEWARDLVVVHLDGVPRGRWGIGGRAVDDAAPAITFGRERQIARLGGPGLPSPVATFCLVFVAGAADVHSDLATGQNDQERIKASKSGFEYVGVRGQHPMGEAGIGLQRAVHSLGQELFQQARPVQLLKPQGSRCGEMGVDSPSYQEPCFYFRDRRTTYDTAINTPPGRDQTQKTGHQASELQKVKGSGPRGTARARACLSD
jgi:phenylpyruvate tautomerase PptA (4-oxalocrotonate tautomerase family)